MTASLTPDLEQKLAGATSLHALQQVLAAEGVNRSRVDIARGLIAEGASPRFAGLSPQGQDQVAQLMVLAEDHPQVLKALTDPDQAGIQLPALLEPLGLQLDAEVRSAISQPLQLDDQQLEQVVGGVITESLILGLAGIIVTGLVTVANHWITEAYKARSSSTTPVA